MPEGIEIDVQHTGQLHAEQQSACATQQFTQALVLLLDRIQTIQSRLRDQQLLRQCMTFFEQIAMACECIASLHSELRRQSRQQIERLGQGAAHRAHAFDHRRAVVSHHQRHSDEQVDQQPERACTCFAEQPCRRSIADQLSKPRRRINDRFMARAAGLPCCRS